MRQQSSFDIDVAMERIEESVRSYPKAGLFELADEGFGSPFELLLACIISIRTRDEVMLPVARSLFQVARTPVAVSSLTVQEIDALISASAFHQAKAAQIHTIARRIAIERLEDKLCSPEVLLSFSGVGPKCANLVLGIACNQAHIGVDIHVHRVTNRWGYVQERNPEATMARLEETLPQKYWVEINRLLVPFGKHICTGEMPRCSTCPVSEMCQQMGVERHR